MNEFSTEANFKDLPYRECAGIMLLNRQKKVFVGQRIDNISDAWQMPQGGIEAGEDYKEAALRELKEEIGTDNVEILSKTDDWFYYDIPNNLIPKLWSGKFRGQKQIWFLANFLGDDSEINIATKEPEFKDWKWAEPNLLPFMIVPFKMEIYKKVIDEFSDYLK